VKNGFVTFKATNSDHKNDQSFFYSKKIVVAVLPLLPVLRFLLHVSKKLYFRISVTQKAN